MSNPITSIVVIADKTRAPPDHIAITCAKDDMSYEADVWKEGMFSFGRTLRYIAVSRSVPQGAYVCNVVSDLAIIGDKEVTPPGFVPIEMTADSREKALRKKLLCVRVTPRDSAVDAVVDIVVLARTKRAPQGYIAAGEIDGLVICYKYGVIPADFGKPTLNGGNPAHGVYPGLPYSSAQTSSGLPGQVHNDGLTMHHSEMEDITHVSHAPPNESATQPGYNTMRQTSISAGSSGIDGVPFELCSALKSLAHARPSSDSMDSVDMSLQQIESGLFNRQYSYDFHTERSVQAST